MKATQMLHNLGQSIWLDNITRDLLDSGTLEHYITDLSVTVSDVLYIGALAALNTVNTMPEETLLAFGEHGRTNGVIPRRVAEREQVFTEFGRVGMMSQNLAPICKPKARNPLTIRGKTCLTQSKPSARQYWMEARQRVPSRHSIHARRKRCVGS
jgi:hypothetical protein